MDAEVAIRAALESLAPDLERTAVEWSSGGIRTPVLRRMDHPYARRHGRALLDPGRINTQRGAEGFAGAWEIEPVRRQGDTLSLAAVNRSPQAGFLEKGTKRMLPRPLPERVEAELRPVVEQRIEQMLKREFRR